MIKCRSSNQGEWGGYHWVTGVSQVCLFFTCRLPRNLNKAPKYSHFRALFCFLNSKDLTSDFWKKRVLPVLGWCLWYGLRQETTVDIISFQPHSQCLALLGDIPQKEEPHFLEDLGSKPLKTFYFIFTFVWIWILHSAYIYLLYL